MLRKFPSHKFLALLPVVPMATMLSARSIVRIAEILHLVPGVVAASDARLV
jgi:hypothetical protein